MTALYHCNVSQKILFIPNQTQNTAAGVQINDKRRPGVGQTHKFSPFALSLAISSHWWQNVCSAALAWMLQFVWPLFGPFAALFSCSVTVRTCEMSSSVKWNNRKCINTEVQHFSWENRCYSRTLCPTEMLYWLMPSKSWNWLWKSTFIFPGFIACRCHFVYRPAGLSSGCAVTTASDVAVPCEGDTCRAAHSSWQTACKHPHVRTRQSTWVHAVHEMQGSHRHSNWHNFTD